MDLEEARMHLHRHRQRSLHTRADYPALMAPMALMYSDDKRASQGFPHVHDECGCPFKGASRRRKVAALCESSVIVLPGLRIGSAARKLRFMEPKV